MPYRLLSQFESLFSGKRYLHRNSSLGDGVAIQLFEDLAALGKSAKFLDHVEQRSWVINTANRRQGIQARRGDGTFGELVPRTEPIIDPGYKVARGNVATVELGVEVKILAKSMIKQIDRVNGDLRKQVDQFRRGGGDPICVAVVGINCATHTVGYEGDRTYATDGKVHRHPAQEAVEAERRLQVESALAYNEFIVLRYIATNEEPYAFGWVNAARTMDDYSSALVRISREYDRRF